MTEGTWSCACVLSCTLMCMCMREALQFPGSLDWSPYRPVVDLQPDATQSFLTWEDNASLRTLKQPLQWDPFTSYLCTLWSCSGLLWSSLPLPLIGVEHFESPSWAPLPLTTTTTCLGRFRKHKVQQASVHPLQKVPLQPLPLSPPLVSPVMHPRYALVPLLSLSPPFSPHSSPPHRTSM